MQQRRVSLPVSQKLTTRIAPKPKARNKLHLSWGTIETGRPHRQSIASDECLSQTAGIHRSISGKGSVASTMLIAEMHEIGTITGEQAAALTGLASVAHDSGTLRGKRAIAGGRRALRHVMCHAAWVAAHHHPSLKSFADRLRKTRKPHKPIITAVARKLVIIANALCKSR